MPEDPIRSLLSRLAPSPIPAPSGMVAYTRSSIQQAGGDPDAVAEWAVGHGGFIGHTHAHGPPWHHVSGEIYYAVPQQALRYRR